MNFVSDHGLALLAGWYLFSSIVSGMPAPAASSGAAYIWAYRSLHLLAGNIGQIASQLAGKGVPKNGA